MFGPMAMDEYTSSKSKAAHVVASGVMNRVGGCFVWSIARIGV